MRARRIKRQPASDVAAKKRLQLVGVMWKDAMFSDSEETPKPVPMLTVGFLVEDTKNHISIAHEIGTDGVFRGVTVVPRGIVVSVLVLRKRIMLDLCK